jgi:hypothetical protein
MRRGYSYALVGRQAESDTSMRIKVAVLVAVVFWLQYYCMQAPYAPALDIDSDERNTQAHTQVERIVLMSKGRYRLRSFDPEAANATTLFVMSDTRDPRAQGYHRLSFLINSRYAAQHEGTFLVYVHTPCFGSKSSTHRAFPPKDCVACFHEKHGGRAAPWCKLPALHAVMEAYPRVSRFVFIDSDAFVNTDASLPSVYFESTLNMFYNYPYIEASPACSGIMFWKAGPEAFRILQEWWDSPGHSMTQDYNMNHDYEQSVFRTSFWQRNRASIHVIPEKVADAIEENPKFRHLWGVGYSSNKRELIMQDVLKKQT